MRKVSPSITKWLVPGALALGVAGCMTDDVDSDELGTAEQEVQAGKRTICHYDGQGRAHEITISENAVPAHFANHGDHDLRTFYADEDGDGHGAGDAIQACSQPPGTSTTSDDCNDGDPAINPGAAEACDGIDNNCDGAYAPTQATKFLDFQGQLFNHPQGVCLVEAEATHTICRDRPGQQILAAGNEAGTVGVYWDEMGIFAVTAPDGTVRGRNYIFFQANCRNQAFESTNIPSNTRPLVDITPLFGDAYGEFSVNLQVRDAFQPYSWNETWVVPGT